MFCALFVHNYDFTTVKIFQIDKILRKCYTNLEIIPQKQIAKERILEIVNSVQDMEVTVDQCDDDLLELGLDSIKFIQIIVSLEETFECEIPDEKLLLTEMNSVNKMFEVLQLAVSESDKSVLK